MPVAKIRDIALALIIVICLALLIGWIHKSTERGGKTVFDEIFKGRAQIIDADSFFIGKHEIRLFGIDAPEGKQYCERDTQKKYACGRAASRALAKFIGKKAIRCEVQTWDRYNRAVSVCYLHQTNLNDWLVRQGWALAYRKYSDAFIAAEQEARARKRGLWQGDFLEPWQWRHIHTP